MQGYLKLQKCSYILIGSWAVSVYMAYKDRPTTDQQFSRSVENL